MEKCPRKKCKWYWNDSASEDNCEWGHKPIKKGNRKSFEHFDSEGVGKSLNYKDCWYYKEKERVIKEIEKL